MGLTCMSNIFILTEWYGTLENIRVEVRRVHALGNPVKEQEQHYRKMNSKKARRLHAPEGL